MSNRLGVRSRVAFTLIELLIVIAIIGILIAAIAVAVTKSKEMAWQNTCGQNMKQVMQAMNTFHEGNACYPTYNGVFPSSTTAVTPGGNNSRQVFGGWFTHLLPFTENKGLHDTIREECASFGNTSWVSIGGGTQLTPTIPGYWKDNSTGLPGNPPANPGEPATIPNPAYTGSSSPVPGNGYSGTAPTTVSPTISNPAYLNTTGYTWVGQVNATYGPPGAPYSGYIGVYRPDNYRTSFKVLICPSDYPATPNSGNGFVYKGSNGASTNPWGSTNYVANWNAITNGNGSLGWQAPPGRRELVEDGAGNTIFLGEAYAWCEGRGRTALLAWHHFSTNYGGVHNFGLTFGLSSISFNGGSAVSVNASNGFPNPSNDPATPLNFGFQIQPQPSKQGDGGCVSLTVQTPHSSMNVAMGDSSVRRVRETVTNSQWAALMLPRDGQPVPGLD